MERKKTVLLCVTGGIAAYKIATLASMLVKTGYDVKVVMTQNATNFINPLVFETLTQHKCLIDTFDRNFEYSVEHVTLAKWADIVMIAPATANVIGKLAHGIADDMLTTTVMACAECKKILAPEMPCEPFINACPAQMISCSAIIRAREVSFTRVMISFDIGGTMRLII